jgi:folate-binding protein YgfZ
VLRFDGADAQSFLQGQLTCDVKALSPGAGLYGGYCTAKGRLLAVFLLWLHEDAYYLMLPRELAEPMRKRLSMYILRAKVKAADMSTALCLYGVHGKLDTPIPDACMLTLPGQRTLIAASGHASGAIEATLNASAPPSDGAMWTRLHIAAGIPDVLASTQEQFVPQMMNLDLIGGVSFSKGCYPGQEIVARTHYLGKVKQRMVRAHVWAATAPRPGDKLFTKSHGEQASGMVVSSAPRAAGGHDVLAVVRLEGLDTDAPRLNSPDGESLTVEPLPYALPAP